MTDNAQRDRANKIYRDALKSGKLVRSTTCERCGTASTRALDGHHHNGYDDEHALDVEWLCQHCHGLAHGGLTQLTDEQRVAISRLGGDAGGQAYAALSPERRSETTRKGWITRYANGWDKQAASQRQSTATRKAWTTRRERKTPDQITNERSAAASKGWARQRARELINQCQDESSSKSVAP